jgi:hypothetical protein
MSWPRYPAAITLAVAAARLATGCGSAAPAAQRAAAPPAPPGGRRPRRLRPLSARHDRACGYRAGLY